MRVVIKYLKDSHENRVVLQRAGQKLCIMTERYILGSLWGTVPHTCNNLTMHYLKRSVLPTSENAHNWSRGI